MVVLVKGRVMGWETHCLAIDKDSRQEEFEFPRIEPFEGSAPKQAPKQVLRGNRTYCNYVKCHPEEKGEDEKEAQWSMQSKEVMVWNFAQLLTYRARY